MKIYSILFIFLFLLIGCHNRFLNDKPKVGDIVEVRFGYYEDCEGEVTRVTDSGVWIYLTDCKGQTGERLFVKTFVRRIR